MSTYEELTEELKTLKKRNWIIFWSGRLCLILVGFVNCLGLYSYKLKGMELQKRARTHFTSSHRRRRPKSNEQQGEGEGQQDTSDSDNEDEDKYRAFGPESTPLSNEYVFTKSFT